MIIKPTALRFPTDLSREAFNKALSLLKLHSDDAATVLEQGTGASASVCQALLEKLESPEPLSLTLTTRGEFVPLTFEIKPEDNSVKPHEQGFLVTLMDGADALSSAFGELEYDDQEGTGSPLELMALRLLADGGRKNQGWQHEIWFVPGRAGGVELMIIICYAGSHDEELQLDRLDYMREQLIPVS